MRRKMSAIYLSDKEQAILKELSEDAGMTMSAFIRATIRQLDHERKTIKVTRKPRAVEYAQ